LLPVFLSASANASPLPVHFVAPMVAGITPPAADGAAGFEPTRDTNTRKHLFTAAKTPASISATLSPKSVAAKGQRKERIVRIWKN
jgi:hypothetical protein